MKRLYTTAIRSGARAIVLCDTVGHATPEGAYNLVKFVIDEVVKPSGEDIRVDWHGHRDRGLAIANSLAAIAAGARQIHGVALSLGERVGNTPDGIACSSICALWDLRQNDLSVTSAPIATKSPRPRTPSSRRIIRSLAATLSARPRASTPPPSSKLCAATTADSPMRSTVEFPRIWSGWNKLSKSVR